MAAGTANFVHPKPEKTAIEKNIFPTIRIRIGRGLMAESAACKRVALPPPVICAKKEMHVYASTLKIANSPTAAIIEPY
jgi:hypothetical protein